ncbi:MAG: M20/M25/M40 family metallo-hydrolase [Bacteroidetes bacterium]|nr:M20/M25/M40 family metallo-hydrolase [Bacteroidota bacterium]
MRILGALLITLIITAHLAAQDQHRAVAERLKDQALTDMASYEMLKELTSTAGHRLSGSVGYEKAVRWAQQRLTDAGADSVWTEPVMVPHWERGPIEKAFARSGKRTVELTVCALGGSVGTEKNGVTGRVIEVRSFEEVRALGEKARGAIIFFNRPFDRTRVNTGEAYGGAVNQRSSGAIEAAKVGAAGVLVRSMTNAIDDEPHTGMMRYDPAVPKIPAAAVSTLDADALSAMIRGGSDITVTLRLSARSFPDVLSSNVIAEIRGSEHPDQIVLVGGHLDAWDKGTGAHDDGSGVAQSIQVIRLMKKLGLRPKRTIRVVLFANEENGLKGALAYAAREQNTRERHIAAIESDAGGFMPRGFGVTADSASFARLSRYAALLEVAGAGRVTAGGGGADIGPLKPFGTALIGLSPESQRYFDYHHSNHDTIDKVHPRELELGAVAMAILAWAIAEDGL